MNSKLADLHRLMHREVDQHGNPYSNRPPGGFYGVSQGLWKLQVDKPELFADDKPKVDAPQGFVDQSAGLYWSEAEKLYWHSESKKFLSTDDKTGQLYEIHNGINQSEELLLVAAGGSSANATGRKVMIEDLHKVAQIALNQGSRCFDHFDRPSSMLAVLRGDDTQTTAAAKKVHTTVLQRLTSHRGLWSAGRVKSALAEVCDELKRGAGNSNVSITISLSTGTTLYVATTGGVRCIVFAQRDTGGFFDAFADDVVNSVGNFAVQSFDMDENFRGFGFMSYNNSSSNAAELSAEGTSAMTKHIARRRPRAAAAAIVGDLRKKTDAEVQVVFVSTQWKTTTESSSSVIPAAKRQKIEVSNQVRGRHILVRHVGAKVFVAADPVRRKPVTRTLEGAEAMLLAALGQLVDDTSAKSEREMNLKFTELCKEMSECETCLKGGAFSGDFGWLAKQDKTQPASIIKAIFNLQLGQLSDIMTSEFGVHILLRTA